MFQRLVTRNEWKFFSVLPKADGPLAFAWWLALIIAFIGLRNGGVIVADPITFVRQGDFSSPPVALCLAGVAQMHYVGHGP